MWELVYYSAAVRKEIKKFPLDIKTRCLEILENMQEFGPVPESGGIRHWEGDIWEITADGKSGWGRVMYIAVENRKIWLLYSFLKKTNTTPNCIAAEVRKRARQVKNA